MRAAVIRDGRLCCEERPDPVAGDTELLVAVRAAGINARTSRSGGTLSGAARLAPGHPGHGAGRARWWASGAR